MADIFISYSRIDTKFVHRLHEALVQQNRDVWVDWEDIPPVAEWLPEISLAIESADNFLFVISPESVSSGVCRRERQHAVAQHKRLVPILHRETESKAIPTELAALNWIFFREQDDFKESLERLVIALETDLPWVKEHTRLLVRALEWDRNHDESLLLRGSDLLNAESWFAQASIGKEPPPNPLHVEYLRVSQELRERERQEALAIHLAEQADVTRNKEARLLPRSVLLALESMRRFPSANGYRSLRSGLALLPRPVGRIQHQDRVFAVRFSPDGRWVASGSDEGGVRIWDVPGQGDVATLNHEGRVTMVSFSPNGQQLATASHDQTVGLWEAATGRRLAVMQHDAPVLSVEFSRDGRWLLTSTGLGLGPDIAAPGTAWIWDTASGREMARVPHSHLAALSFMTFLTNEFWVISGTDNRRILIWEATTGKSAGEIQVNDVVVAIACHPTKPLLATNGLDMKMDLWDLAAQGHIATIDLGKRNSPVAFSPQGRWLATVTGDQKVRVWETDSLHEIAQFPCGHEVTELSFSPDEQMLATVSYWGGVVQLWELRNQTEIARIGHDQAYSIAFNTDGRLLVSASDDRAAWVWETSSGGDAVWVLKHAGMGGTARFSPNGDRVGTGTTTYQTATGWISSPADLKGVLRVLDAVSGREIIQIPHGAPVKKVQFSPNGRRVASIAREACLWDAEDGHQVVQLPSKAGINDLVFSPDGLRVGTASDDGRVQVWEVETGVEVARIENGARLFAVAFSPDGQWIAAASEDGNMRIWDVLTRQEVSRITHGKVPVWKDSFCLVFGPNGKWLVSPGAENTAGVWETATGRELVRIVHEYAVIALALSGNGERVVTAATSTIVGGSTPGEVRVWQSATGATVSEKKLESAAKAVALSPDGGWAAAGQANGGILVWEVETGNELVLLQHDASVNSVAFSPNGRLLVSASQDETVRVWLWRPEDLVHEACARLTRNLSPAEWKEYLGDEKFCPTGLSPAGD